MFSPKTEWEAVKSEEPAIPTIITGYVVPLAGAAAVAAFIGYGLVGVSAFGFKQVGMNWGLYHGVLVLGGALLGVFVSAYVIDMLAPSFGSEKNMGRSVQLVAYSMTPGWVGGLLAILPALGIIGSLFGLYGLYLLYEGLPRLKNTPEDKKTSYFVVSILVTIAVYIVAGLILAAIFTPIFGTSTSYEIPVYRN